MKLILVCLFLPLASFGQLTNNTLYPFDEKLLNEFSYELSRNDSIIPVYKNGSYQYINSYTLTPHITTLFDLAYPFHDGYGLVKRDGKYGIIDKIGRYIIEPKFTTVQLLDYPDAILFNTREWFSFNEGKLFTGYYGEIHPVIPEAWYYKNKGKYGLTLRNGSKYKAIYDSVLAIGINYIVVKKRGKIGVINDAQEILIPFSNNECVIGSGYTPFFALKRNSLWHYYQNPRTLLFKTQFKPASLNHGVLIFETSGLFNYFDNNGNIMLPKNYKWISKSGHIAINERDELVLFNKEKKEFIYFNPKKL